MMFKDTTEGQTNYCPSCEELQRQLEEKTRLLAAWEAQPVVGAVSGGKYKSFLREYSERLGCGWKEIIEKPSTTAHLDALLAEAERKGMERAAKICDNLWNNGIVTPMLKEIREAGAADD